MANELRKMNIYDINEAIENAMIYGVDEWGEVLDEDGIKDYVDKLEITQQSKMEYMAKLTINSDLFSKDIKAEIKKLEAKDKAVTNGSERTKTYLDRFIRNMYTDENGVLDEDGLKKFKLKTPSIEISYRKSSKIDVTDITKVPKEFVKTTIEEKADKVGLKSYMSDNKLEETEYAKIITGVNISIK